MKRKNKVLMLLTNPFISDPRVYKEAKSLVKAGYEVTILCWDRQLKHKKKEKIDGINVERIRLRAGYGFKSMIFKLPIFWIKLFFKALKKDFDIVHSHDFDTAIVGYLLKVFKRKKWVYDSHDLYFTYFLKNCKKTLIYRVIEKLDVFLARRCDLLLVPTESLGGKYKGLKEYYKSKGIKNILTIWNVPITKEFLNYKKIQLKKPKGLVIGFIGTIRNIYSLEVLFKALTLLGNKYVLIFVGGGKGVNKVKELYHQKYSNLRIIFYPEQPYKLIPNYYNICDAIFSVYKNSKEAECNLNEKGAIQAKIFEAAILGIPTIVPDYFLGADFVKKYNCGITINELKPKILANAIKSSVRLRINTEKIKKDWNWHNEEEKLLNVYRRLK